MTLTSTTIQEISPTIKIRGQLVDNHTRCSHYHTDLDIIAIKFQCCPNSYYYPCFKCHQELNNHDIKKYPMKTLTVKVILCGDCYHEMTIEEYLNSNYGCPSCNHQFNPGCRNHYDLYFE